MLLGSDDTLNHIGDSGEYFHDIPEPILVISPVDLFGNDVEFKGIHSGTLSRLKKEIERRLPAVINRHAGEYSEAFKKAVRDPKFKTESAENIKDGLPFSYSIEHILESRSAFMPGIVFVPGNTLDPKVYAGKATSLKPNEITGEIGSAEFWKTILTFNGFLNVKFVIKSPHKKFLIYPFLPSPLCRC